MFVITFIEHAIYHRLLTKQIFEDKQGVEL